jgi:hypothetical protein
VFPTPVAAPRLSKNAPFDVCESRLKDSFYNSWEDIKHNVILDWVDLADESGDHGLGIGAGKFELVELDGRVIRELTPTADGNVRLRIPRFGIRTLRLSGKLARTAGSSGISPPSR